MVSPVPAGFRVQGLRGLGRVSYDVNRVLGFVWVSNKYGFRIF